MVTAFLDAVNAELTYPRPTVLFQRLYYILIIILAVEITFENFEIISDSLFAIAISRSTWACLSL